MNTGLGMVILSILLAIISTYIIMKKTSWLSSTGSWKRLESFGVTFAILFIFSFFLFFFFGLALPVKTEKVMTEYELIKFTPNFNTTNRIQEDLKDIGYEYIIDTEKGFEMGVVPLSKSAVYFVETDENRMLVVTEDVPVTCLYNWFAIDRYYDKTYEFFVTEEEYIVNMRRGEREK